MQQQGTRGRAGQGRLNTIPVEGNMHGTWRRNIEWVRFAGLFHRFCSTLEISGDHGEDGYRGM
jgi:hypothetical protein